MLGVAVEDLTLADIQNPTVEVQISASSVGEVTRTAQDYFSNAYARVRGELDGGGDGSVTMRG